MELKNLMNKYMILPSSNDLNRGDQALVWETIRIAKESGFNGTFYMLSGRRSSTKQSQDRGIQILSPILKHPGRKFKSKENNEYNINLIVKWGIVAFFDLIKSLLLLTKFTRFIIYPFLSVNDKNTLKILEESKACFVKGGGFIHSAGKLTDSYTIYFQLFHLMLAQAYNKPVYVMPNSFGPFDGFAVAKLVYKVLKRCKIVTVRETISQHMLNEIGIDTHLFPDLGFRLNKKVRKNNEIIYLRKQYPTYQLVAITARPYRFPGSTNPIKSYHNYVRQMAKFSKWLFDNKYFPVFVEHTLSETTHENDSTCILEITSMLNPKEYYFIRDKNYTCQDLKAIYSEFDYVIGTRFHSVIFSLSEGVPAIAITYGGNKGQGIMHDLNLSKFAIEINKFDATKAISAFMALNENRVQICTQIANKNLQIRENYIQLINMLEKYS